MKYLLILLLTGCSSLSIENKETFAICKSVDIGTTIIALKSGRFVESNVLVKSSLSYGYFPLIIISFGLYKWIEYANDKTATEFANVVTCGAAGWNIGQLILH